MIAPQMTFIRQAAFYALVAMVYAAPTRGQADVPVGYAIAVPDAETRATCPAKITPGAASTSWYPGN